MLVWALGYVRLCESMDCSLPGSSVQGICQARILEWVAMPSRGSSQTRNQTRLPLSATAHGFFTTEPPGELILIKLDCFAEREREQKKH